MDKRFRNRQFRFHFKPIKLELGQHYCVYNDECKFIQVTAKGFNFLNLQTNKCIFKRHLYDKRYYRKAIPKNIKTVHTTEHIYYPIIKVS